MNINLNGSIDLQKINLGDVNAEYVGALVEVKSTFDIFDVPQHPFEEGTLRDSTPPKSNKCLIPAKGTFILIQNSFTTTNSVYFVALIPNMLVKSLYNNSITNSGVTQKCFCLHAKYLNQYFKIAKSPVTSYDNT